jgi:hypothetical protein
MKIQSKYKDYYDSANNLQFDSNLFYDRTKTIIEDKQYNLYSNNIDINNVRLEYKVLILGYCGKLIPIIQYNLYLGSRSEYNNHELIFLKQIQSYLETNKFYLYDDKVELFSKYLKEELNKMSYFGWGSNNLYEYCRHKISQIKIENYFEKYHSPLFLLSNNQLIINPSLKEIEFFNFKPNVYEVYQDIEIYLGNVLIENKTPIAPVGSDIDLLISKGFDKRTSFRKEKETKK